MYGPQVYADVSSMNRGDCFLLDTGKGDILVYVGGNAKRVEKIKATQAANMIRDQDHHGRAKVSIIGKARLVDRRRACFPRQYINFALCCRRIQPCYRR